MNENIIEEITAYKLLRAIYKGRLLWFYITCGMNMPERKHWRASSLARETNLLKVHIHIPDI